MVISHKFGARLRARFEVQGSRFEDNPQPLAADPSRLAPGPNPEPRTSNLPLSCGEPDDKGFTLLELLIVMVIIATLAAIAIPSYVRNIQRAKEAVLREDLHVLRNAIDSYTVDKQQAPQSLDDLVTSGYLHEIPNDPFTNHKDWITDTSGMLTSVDQTDAGGIDDVHSADQKTALDGTTYNTW
jgi:general secretion pathway protein G